MPPLPQLVPSITGLQMDTATLGWQLWQGFVGLGAPLAYGVPPMTQPAPESGLFASRPASTAPLDATLRLDPDLLLLREPEPVLDVEPPSAWLRPAESAASEGAKSEHAGAVDAQSSKVTCDTTRN